MDELSPILIAEDNPNDVELLLEALQADNLANRVTIVRDGVEALEFLRCEGRYHDRHRIDPAVAILDIKMPRMDGLEVLRNIRADPRLRLLPVVMLTSSNEECDLIQSYELGVNAYVRKPVRFVDFISAVRDLGSFWAIVNHRPLNREGLHE